MNNSRKRSTSSTPGQGRCTAQTGQKPPTIDHSGGRPIVAGCMNFYRVIEVPEEVERCKRCFRQEADNRSPTPEASSVEASSSSSGGSSDSSSSSTKVKQPKHRSHRRFAQASLSLLRPRRVAAVAVKWCIGCAAIAQRQTAEAKRFALKGETNFRLPSLFPR